MLEPYPNDADFRADPEAEAEIAWLKALVVGVRQIRGENNLARSTPLGVVLADTTDLDRARVERHTNQLQRLAGLRSIEIAAPGSTVKGAATAIVGGIRLLVPLAGLIDVGAERERLTKQLARTRDDLAKAQRKLENQNFVANAPEDIVAKERARVAELEQRALQLEQQLAAREIA